MRLVIGARRSPLKTFRAEVPEARIVLVTGARHFIFLSHVTQVANQMRTFSTSDEAARAVSRHADAQ